MASAKHFDSDRPDNPFDNDDGTPFDGGSAKKERVRERKRQEAKQEAREENQIPGWMDYPVECLPKSIGDFVCAASAALDCDPALVAHPVMALLSGAVGNSFRVQAKRGWVEPATAWFVTVISSGGAKSPAQHAALKPVYELENQAREQHKRRLAEHAEELEAYKERDRSNRGAKPQKPEPIRFLVGDTTIETLMVIHDRNPRGLLLVRDELGGWLGSFDRYNRGEADQQSWIEIHDGKPTVRDRKSDGDIKGAIFIKHPSVSVIGGIQPSTLRGKLKQTHLTSGFVPRLLLVMPPFRPQRWSEAQVTQEVEDTYTRTIHALYQIQNSDGPEILALSPEAKRLFKLYVNETAGEVEILGSEVLRSMATKMKATALRFSLLFHLADCAEAGVSPGAITGDAMARALRLARWYKREASRVYQFLGFDQGATEDERKVRLLPEVFNREDVEAVFGVRDRQAYNVIKRLMTAGMVKKFGRGKYRNCTLFNPFTFSQNRSENTDIPRNYSLHDGYTFGNGVNNASDAHPSIAPKIALNGTY